ncbi:hypothetical protein G6F46_014816 [Rhizopus delemar]|nr:hypothetical protein G6F46_014816 [Rhizopus delemar]
MTPGTPALTQFPVNAWRRAQDRALQAAPATTLGYGHPVGEPALREAIAPHFPPHGGFGEEFGALHTEAELVWSLDPIDGTRAFISGNPLNAGSARPIPRHG